MKKISLSLIMGMIMLLSGCFDNRSWTEKVNGTYYGLMWSGGSNLGCTTYLDVDFNGTLSGNYVMLEPRSAEEGVIEKCEVLQKGKIQCKWRDRYGFGDVVFEFSSSFNGFKAIWNDEGKYNQNFSWVGKKDSPHIQKAKIVLDTINVNNNFERIIQHHFNQIINIYPIVRNHKKIFFDYYRKYLNLTGVDDELISFLISKFSIKALDMFLDNQKNQNRGIEKITQSIKFQSVVIGRSKANNHFDEFIEMLEKKENNEGNNKISYTSKSLQ